MRKRNRGRGREIAEYTTAIGGTALRGQGAAGPKGGGAQQVRPARLSGAPALGRPTGFSARFQTAAPGRRSADWKFHNDRHQPRAGAATPRWSSLSPPRLPRKPDPTNSTSTEVPTRVPPPAPCTQKAPSGTGPMPPTKLRRESSRGAPRPRRRRAEPASLRVRPGTRCRDHLRLAPRARPAGFRPTHPARWRAGRGPKQAYSPAPALTHLSASPCRRARRCRVPLCTLRTQTNPPPAPAPPPASP